MVYVNLRHTKKENVCIVMNDATFGETRGMFLADARRGFVYRYRAADKLYWCLLKVKPVPVTLDDSDSDSEPPEMER